MRTTFPALAAALLIACGSPAPNPFASSETNAEGDGDAHGDAPDPSDSPDGAPGADGSPRFDGKAPDGTDPADGEDDGDFGEHCTFNEECDDGLCVVIDLATGESVCTKFCVTECPDGWGCKPFAVGSDPANYCIPLVDALCQPCGKNSDCGFSGALCLAIEDGHCGANCDKDGEECPDGFACVDITGPDDELLGKQCVPLHGSCDCEATVDFQTDPLHCGGCDDACEFPNGVATCVEGSCHLAACVEGWFDLNEQSGDGCEYPCTVDDSVEIDWPDEAYVDVNCDGIDGHVTRAVFVAPDGTDNGNTAGTMELPFKTIKAAMTFTAAEPEKDQILVSKGTYIQQIVVTQGVNLFGGYDRSAGWARDVENNETIIRWEAVDKGTIRTLVASGISEPTVVDGFSIEAVSNPAPGGSSIAVQITDGSAGLVVSNNRIVAGNGGPGVDGIDGQPGQDGDAGSDGTEGVDDSCKPEKPVIGGKAGKNSCDAGDASGGDGGNAGWGGSSSCDAFETIGCAFQGCKGKTDAQSGKKGAGELGGAGGTGGPVEDNGGNGVDGMIGGAGPDGDGGEGGGDVGLDDLWHPTAGEAGAAGGRGGGGGGAGGGGGSDNGAVGDAASHGGSGGGGGAGGCGGTHGTPGTGGGASIAVLVVAASPHLVGNFLVYRNGGNGGNGGMGGDGGLGGDGGIGGGGWDQSAPGGNGGAGAAGGRGGHGGGGGGGPSIGILNWGPANPTCMGTIYSQEGTPGLGGVGGDGTSDTANGKPGITNSVVNLTLDCLPE